MGEEKYRAEQAADSILGDERLTAGLEDELADFLLEWGLALATTAAADTRGIDDEDSTQILQPRIKAIKKMIRYVNYWLQNSNIWDPVEKEEKLSKIFKISRLAYGNDLEYEMMTNAEEPAGPELEVFLSQAWTVEGNSIEAAIELRQLLEGNGQEIMNG